MKPLCGVIYQIWRLSEAGPDNLGPACTDDGLLLGRTPLIERREESFVVRDRNEIQRLFAKAYGGEPRVDRLMSGLATVASALNANDACLARIAAVHLKIPDPPNQGGDEQMRRGAMAIIKGLEYELSGGQRQLLLRVSDNYGISGIPREAVDSLFALLREGGTA